MIKAMVSCGDIAMAKEHCRMLNLPEALVCVDPMAVAAGEASRALKFFQLALPIDRVWFVDKEDQLPEIESVLKGAKVIGMDVEWKPQHGKGPSSKASILQVSKGEHLWAVKWFKNDQDIKRRHLQNG